MTKATELRELASLTTIASGQIQFDSDLKIAGDLITTGNTINITADTLNISDPNITLASGAANSAIADGAGITIDGADATLTWDDANNRFSFNKHIYASGGQSVFSTALDAAIKVESTDPTTGIAFTDSTSTRYLFWRGSDNSFYFDGTNTRFGINKSDPQYELDISGTGFRLADSSGVNDIKMGIYGGITMGGNGAGIRGIGTDSNEEMRITQNNVETIKIERNTRHVIIGNDTSSDSPAHQLDVVGDINARESFRTDQVRHSIRPTLNLDFANSKELDSRITFYRDSIATYYDSKGVLRYANTNTPRFDHDPATGESKGLLIEEARSNIFNYTNNPEKWSLMSAGSSDPIVNNRKSPDGTYNATSLIITGGDPYFYQNNLTLNGTYTFSYWIKAWGNAVGKHYTIRVTNVSNNQSIAKYLPSEWTRVSYTFTTSSTTTAYIGIEAPDNNPANGDEVSIWGAQLELGAFPTSYVPSDTRFISRSSEATYHDENGILRTAPANSPRYGYKYDGRKWVETGLILENAATNYMTRPMSAFDYNMAVAPTYDQLGPDGSNTAVDVEVSSSNWPTDYFYTSYTDHRASTVAGTYTFSFFVKPDTSGEWPFNIYFDNAHHRQSATVVAGIWQRVSYTFTTLASNLTFNIYAYDNRSAQGNISSGVVWGPQVEDGYAATSYLYTYFGTTTRSADVASSVAYTRERDWAEILDMNWLGSKDEMTIYGEAYSLEDGASNPLIASLCEKDTIDNFSEIALLTNSTYIGFSRYGGTQTIDTTPANGKNAITVTADNIKGSRNGGAVITESTFGKFYPYNTRLIIGNDPNGGNELNGTLKKLAYYPERLSDAELQALTENN